MSPVTIQEIRAVVDKVDGWLGKREGPYLYSLAKLGSQLGVIVEIGSWKGKSTVWLAKGSEAGRGTQVYAIDPHVGGPDQEKLGYKNVNTVEEFGKNIKLAGVETIVTPLVMASMQAVEGWNSPIGLLWIDGDHSYDSVRSDFYSWEPFVTEGGIVALHDTYSWEGVRRLVDQELLSVSQYRVLGQVDGILAVQKVRSLSAVDRVKRGSVLCLRKVYNYGRKKRKHWRALPRKLLRGLSTPGIGS